MGVDKAFSELDTKGDNKISPEELAAFFKVSKQAITYYSIIESDPEELSFFKVCFITYFSLYFSLHINYVQCGGCRYTDIWELFAFIKDKPAGLLLVEQVRKQPINYYRERGRGRREMMVVLL